MSKDNNGGAAFPRTGERPGANTYPYEVAQEGMTLRDYFAAKAMVGLINVCPEGTIFGDRGEEANNTYARVAYAMADAMLEARKR